VSTTGQIQLAPIPVTLDNSDEWPAFEQQISSVSGMPTAVTRELVTTMVGSAVPMLFSADAAGDAGVLRGTFSDAVVAQCQRNVGNFMGEQPVSAVVHLAGARMEGEHAVLRVHLSVSAKNAEGGEALNGQFWDLQLGGNVTVGQPTCPNCGGPIPPGQLICGHCGTDVRSVVNVPLVVTKIEAY
jgi:hypothetical protein